MVSVLFFFISILLFTSILLAPVYVWKLIQKAGHPNAGHAKYQNTRTQGFTQEVWHIQSRGLSMTMGKRACILLDQGWLRQS
jgi:predicted small integral membrane protein